MSKFYGYDEAMENDIAKITTPKLALMSDVVASDKKFIRMENGALTVIAGVLIAVGNSVFKTEKTTLTASNLDGTATKFEVGKDYCIYICDPTGGDATNFAAEQYRISLNTTYPNGYTAVTSRKIGGFHYGVVRKTNSSGIPISASGAALGSGWETNVTEGIVPNSVWTLLHRPTCDPTGMVYIGPFWGDIYLSSDNGASGLQSKKGAVPITGTEGLNWYIANERAMRVGKRLPTYAEFCKVFKVWEPKERIIMALPFYDRVIQHMIVNYIEPIFEHQFIYHSYACRKGKGAHRASKQLTRWLYNLEVVQGKSVYVLKADIHHYFQSIDHKVLKREIRTYIKDKDLLVILDRIIDHNGIFPDGVGIPVGNLTSQLFANVYLHRLDMFVKHTLHAEHYMRYMDDFVIISEDLEQLKRWEKQIEIFLADVLKLQLNPKTTIVYAKNGVDFVGYRHWNSTKKIRKDAMRRLKRLMKNFKDGTITEEFFDKSFTSRIGSIKHADTYNLVQKITCEAKELKESHA